MPADKLHRTLLINALSGALLGLIVVSLLLLFDIAGLRRLAIQDDAGLVPVLLLCGGFVITCSSLLMGTAIMTMHRDDRDDDDHRGGGGRLELARVRVRARGRR